MKAAVSIVVAALVSWAVYAFAWQPYRCNVLKKQLAPATAKAEPDSPSNDDRILARRTAEQLESCLHPGCRDVALDIELGANYLALGRRDAAYAMYQHALTLDRRPEIYLCLATVEIADGRREEAIDHITRSVFFDPYTIRNIDDPILRDTAIKRLVAAHPADEATFRMINGLPSTN